MRNRLFGYRDAGPVFIWAFVGLQAVSFVFALIASAVPAVADNLYLSGLLTNAALAAAYLVYTKATGIDPIRGARLDGRFRLWVLPLFCVLTYLLQYASYGSMTLFDNWLRSGGYESKNPLMDVTFTEYGAGGLVGYILLVGFATGFCEELIFRGALLQALRGKLRDGTAIVVSAVAFMLFHGSPDQTIFQFLFGLLLAYVTVRTGSVVPAMVMHAFNNVFSIATTAGGVADRVFLLPAQTGALIAVALAGLLAAFVLLPAVVDAATGHWDRNFLRRLFSSVRRKTRRNVSAAEQPSELATAPMSECGAPDEDAGDADGGEEPAILDPTPNPNADKLSTVLLAVGGIVCIALWIAALVAGF